jgi:cellulose synthase/poly-beta-1,6-N-acetylglucosamine synthase-like glycosyltransferase
MISIVITAYKEEKTIGRAIEALLKNEIEGEYEILAVCPDEATKRVIDRYVRKHPVVKHVRDQGKGKPAALNKAFQLAKGDILILTDGDVYISENAIHKLLKKLQDDKVGAVSARPVSISPKNTMLGYWSHLLTDAGAHLTRLERVKRGEFIVVSGYLFAMKRVFEKIPEDALADDGVMSHMIWQKGYKIDYADKALVYVKYPTIFKDWMLQKKRSTGGYTQIKKYFGENLPRMRTFKNEALHGAWKALTYPKTPKEISYTITLFLARLYLWLRIYIDLRSEKIDFQKTWKRVETTK